MFSTTEMLEAPNLPSLILVVTSDFIGQRPNLANHLQSNIIDTPTSDSPFSL